jgi:hypothetical protein
MPTKSRAAENAKDRKRIREADPVGMLIDVARGMPIPRRDIDGEIVAYDQVDVPVRVAAMERLLKRVLPELQSVSIDAAGEGVSFTVLAPFPLPGSQRSGLQQAADALTDGTAQKIEARTTLEGLGDGLRSLQVAPEAQHAATEPDPHNGPCGGRMKPGQ